MALASSTASPKVANTPTGIKNPGCLGNKMCKSSTNKSQTQASIAYARIKANFPYNTLPQFPSSTPAYTSNTLPKQINLPNRDLNQYRHYVEKTSWYVSPFDGCTVKQCLSAENKSSPYDNSAGYQNWIGYGYGNSQLDDCPDCLYLENLAKQQNHLVEQSTQYTQSTQSPMKNVQATPLDNSNNQPDPTNQQLPTMPYMELDQHTECDAVSKCAVESTIVQPQPESAIVDEINSPVLNATFQVDSNGPKSFASIESYDERTKLIKQVFAKSSPMSSFENDYSKFRNDAWDFESDQSPVAIKTVPIKTAEELSPLDQAVRLQNEEMQLRSQVTESLNRALMEMPLDEYIKVVKAVLGEVVGNEYE